MSRAFSGSLGRFLPDLPDYGTAFRKEYFYGKYLVFGEKNMSFEMKQKAQRIRWLGHIQRMDQARPSKKLIDWKRMGTRQIGRPRQRWQEEVMEDVTALMFPFLHSHLCN